MRLGRVGFRNWQQRHSGSSRCTTFLGGRQARLTLHSSVPVSHFPSLQTDPTGLHLHWLRFPSWSGPGSNNRNLQPRPPFSRAPSSLGLSFCAAIHTLFFLFFLHPTASSERTANCCTSCSPSRPTARPLLPRSPPPPPPTSFSLAIPLLFERPAIHIPDL